MNVFYSILNILYGILRGGLSRTEVLFYLYTITENILKFYLKLLIIKVRKKYNVVYKNVFILFKHASLEDMPILNRFKLPFVHAGLAPLI